MIPRTLFQLWSRSVGPGLKFSIWMILLETPISIKDPCELKKRLLAIGLIGTPSLRLLSEMKASMASSLSRLRVILTTISNFKFRLIIDTTQWKVPAKPRLMKSSNYLATRLKKILSWWRAVCAMGRLNFLATGMVYLSQHSGKWQYIHVPCTFAHSISEVSVCRIEGRLSLTQVLLSWDTRATPTATVVLHSPRMAHLWCSVN